MASENNISTIHLTVRNELFELSSSLFRQLIEYSSNFDLTISIPDKQHKIYIDVDPCIFNSYLLFIQSGCFIRPDHLSQEDLINGLRTCGAPNILLNHYEHCDLMSSLSLHQYSYHSINKIKFTRQTWLSLLILSELFISTCILTIDLYRQILIFNKNSFQETSKILITLTYVIDGILFFYSSVHCILKFRKGIQFNKDFNFFVDIISCLGILCYFTIQRPITNISLSYWNSLWIFIHLCRSIRLLQIGYRLIDIQWCLYAISQCLWTFFQTIIALFWIFIFSGSILYLMDIIENNQQYLNIYSAILSAHETLYTIGYRNNAPYGRLTRLWTILSIYYLSSLVQILCWWFQTKVTIQWKKLLDNEKQKLYDEYIIDLK
ncbi:unnamed protein product [Adineta steineri]|uniref:Uncharacterized protein n=1 Tax=Adineta steineri TaxID=433720 RepID=A0A813ZK01_9BILA|nr:unnamed protein product [Adineta steineri]CAF0928911.1 unnamed protein product [Adineta steineri]